MLVVHANTAGLRTDYDIDIVGAGQGDLRHDEVKVERVFFEVL